MARYWIGTSGYSYKEWKGNFYPASLSDGEMLHFYGERFATVEINHTFYKMASVRQLQGWSKEVPEDFVFTLKAPRRITHDLRLRDAADIATDFCATARSLKSKLGAILFQLPPFLKRDVPRLEDFLHQMSPGFRVAFEFRNPTWFEDEVYETLRRFGVALCVVESPDRAVPLEVTAEFGYFRLRQPEYSDEEMESCARRIETAAASWNEVFVYFKHEEAGRGPLYAAKLRALLEGGPATAAAGI
jgi:uncharacterized protein YecE (DUF72 family)